MKSHEKDGIENSIQVNKNISGAVIGINKNVSVISLGLLLKARIFPLEPNTLFPEFYQPFWNAL